MADQLSELQKYTVIVADTGDIEAIRKYKPTDATTNPSLLLAASEDKQYSPLIEDAIEYAKKNAKDCPKARVSLAMDKLAVNFGKEISKIIPGLVSTEVDARLSFDEEASYQKALQLIRLYQDVGVSKDRILIKVASTWEGLRAAERLEKQGVHCNLTLLFSFAQAVAAAEAKVTLISPFVGRIMDWYQKKSGVKSYAPEEDPGVKSVKKIYNYYKTIGSKTVVMGASFRNKGQIIALAGCDKLTIAPQLLNELKSSKEPFTRALKPETKVDPSQAIHLTEKEFRWQLNEDAMATEKLAEGIRKFAEDAIKLEGTLAKRLNSAKL